MVVADDERRRIFHYEMFDYHLAIHNSRIRTSRAHTDLTDYFMAAFQQDKPELLVVQIGKPVLDIFIGIGTVQNHLSLHHLRRAPPFAQLKRGHQRHCLGLPHAAVAEKILYPLLRQGNQVSVTIGQDAL